MNWSSWKMYFETNGSRPLPKVSAAGAPTDEEIRGSLARTFSVFQLGEAGEGWIAREVKSFESESSTAIGGARSRWIRGSLDINSAPLLAEEIDRVVGTKPPR